MVELYLLPIVCAAMAWFVSGIEPAFRFADLARVLGARDELRYAQLATLALLLLAAICVIRIFRNK